MYNSRRNFNFKNPAIDLPKVDHIGWPVSGFKQLVPDHRLLCSKLTKEQIDGYFIYRLAGIQMAGDLKALEKGMGMFTGNKNLVCSVIVFVNCIFLSEPVTADKIPTKQGFSDEHLADPHPEQYTNWSGYNDYDRNNTINFCASNSADIAMRYLHPKADIQTAQKDHDYLHLPFGENWVDRALQINEIEARQLERLTRGQADNKKWFAARRWRITASQFGEISKMSTKRDKNKLCKSLINCKIFNTLATLHACVAVMQTMGLNPPCVSKFQNKDKTDYSFELLAFNSVYSLIWGFMTRK
ncbi:hypothetical protein KUTeg_013281, partial [Tegillarca granosa]